MLNEYFRLSGSGFNFAKVLFPSNNFKSQKLSKDPDLNESQYIFFIVFKFAK